MSAAQNTTPSPVFVVLTAGGLALARRAQGALPGASVHGLAGRVDGADEAFTDTMAHIGDLFDAGVPVIGICASGILIRAVASRLGDKRAEPPVVAISEDGLHVVPLLGGHVGANDLARALADVLGGSAAVTTAGDVAFGLALDAPPRGWRVENPEAAKPVTAALLADQPVGLTVACGDAGWITETDAPFVDDETILPRVMVCDQTGQADPETLVLHPPVLALGVGCERGADAQELIGLADKALADAGLSSGAVGVVVSLDLKSDEAAVHGVADHFGVAARFFDAATLEKETPRLANPSDVVFAEVGCHGVAEGAALAAVGSSGSLVLEKSKSARATCAVARSMEALDSTNIGHRQGKLTVVGIGPGKDDWRTPAASNALRGASDIVGYQLYLDLLGNLIDGKTRHDSPLAEEEKRARMALDLAAEGRDVVLVGSGDAGIYALATLVFELLDRENRGDWNRLAIAVEPGVSAFQAAAARIGAPMGHDFCTISLSDLLTPWEAIEMRLEAAAAGDFVVAFYNPVSKRRRSQLVAARDILLKHRPANTPVVLARNLGREGETVRVIHLADLTVDDADMLTMVVVGSSATRYVSRGVNGWVYTPRGYAKKMKDQT